MFDEYLLRQPILANVYFNQANLWLIVIQMKETNRCETTLYGNNGEPIVATCYID